jgi:post-segregation antitoxin (ccd killing protein)
MARINIYVPDDLAEAARRAGVNVSSIAQGAIRNQLAQESTNAWLATLQSVPAHKATHERAIEALDAARDEAPTRHG